MPLNIEAVYEDGVLRPLQPSKSALAREFTESAKAELQETDPPTTLEDVRSRLAKIPGSMAAEIIASRGQR